MQITQSVTSEAARVGLGVGARRVPESVELVPAAGARILLVGGWDAALAEDLKRRGATQVVGLTPPSASVAQGAAKVDAVHEVALTTAMALPYPPGHFDVLWVSDTLERAEDPAALLRTLRTYVKDNGRLVCHVPNVRNEWVILRLLVDGSWAHADDGILSPGHVRFFTRAELDRVLTAAGLETEGNVRALRSQPSAWLETASDLVGKLGGDVEAFRAEATVVRFVVVARPAGAAALDAAQGDVNDPWNGARSTHILVAPRWSDPNDGWPEALEALCRRISDSDDTTIGVTLPPGGVEAVPPPLLAFARAVPTDIVLLDAPTDIAAWQRLVSSAHVFVATGDRPELMDMARRAGVEIAEGRGLRSAG